MDSAAIVAINYTYAIRLAKACPERQTRPRDDKTNKPFGNCECNTSVNQARISGVDYNILGRIQIHAGGTRSSVGWGCCVFRFSDLKLHILFCRYMMQ